MQFTATKARPTCAFKQSGQVFVARLQSSDTVLNVDKYHTIIALVRW